MSASLLPEYSGTKLKVLLVSAEVSPITKIGGLGDVAASLPKALEKINVNVDVISPFYPFAKIENLNIYKILDLPVPFAGDVHNVEVFRTKLPDSNVDVILLKNSKYFINYGKIGKITDVPELDTFSFFDRAVVEYIKAEFNTYDLVHCNDWHTGLITHLLADEIPDSRPGTLFTIHNLMYQGVGDEDIVERIGFVPGSHPLIDWDIADGDINFLQQGITACDFINTVSPTYAKEILTTEFGGEMTDILIAREARLVGILNGIDYSTLPRSYDASNFKVGKAKIKQKLLKSLNLQDQNDDKPLFGNNNAPLFSYVGRLDPYQKGINILFDVIKYIIENGGKFVLLGDGDKEWKDKLIALSNDPKYSKSFSCNVKFDTDLALNIYAGSDFLIVPSRYEPCGLIQMIAMWYGAVPIVRATGGLKDSVTQQKTGFLFNEYSTDSLKQAVAEAFSTYTGHDLEEIIKNDLTADFSWDLSAQKYKELYNKVVQIRKSANG